MTECEDAISRADVDNALYEYWHDINIVDDSGYFIYKDSMDIIKKLPSVHLKAKVGKWITWSEEIECDGYTEYKTRCKCSECNTEYDGYFTHFIKYCSNCGAKMEGVQE